MTTPAIEMADSHKQNKKHGRTWKEKTFPTNANFHKHLHLVEMAIKHNMKIVFNQLSKNLGMPRSKNNKQNSQKLYKTGVINDPLGQTHSLASSEHCFC